MVRNLEDYVTTIPATITWDEKHYSSVYNQTGKNQMKLKFSGANSNGSNTGVGVEIEQKYNAAAPVMQLKQGAVQIGSTDNTIWTNNTWYSCKMEITATDVRFKYWVRSGSEGAGWNIEGANAFSSAGGYLEVYATVQGLGGVASQIWIDNIKVESQ